MAASAASNKNCVKKWFLCNIFVSKTKLQLCHGQREVYGQRDNPEKLSILHSCEFWLLINIVLKTHELIPIIHGCEFLFD